MEEGTIVGIVAIVLVLIALTGVGFNYVNQNDNVDLSGIDDNADAIGRVKIDIETMQDDISDLSKDEVDQDDFDELEENIEDLEDDVDDNNDDIREIRRCLLNKDNLTLIQDCLE